MSSDLRKCFVEFIGTFFFAFTILCCVLLPVNPIIAPIIIGLTLAILVYLGGPLSGGHYNPAVSLTIFLIGRMGSKKTLLYCVFQIFGAAYAALMVLSLSSLYKNYTPGTYTISQIFIGEIIFTTLLILTVLFTAVSKRVQGNNYFGLAIGGAVSVGAYAAGSLCLTAFNPAIAIALGLSSVTLCGTVCLTILANVVAAIVSCLIFKIVNLDDIEKVEVVGIDEFIRK